MWGVLVQVSLRVAPPTGREIRGNYMKFLIKTQWSKHKTILEIEAYIISTLEPCYFLNGSSKAIVTFAGWKAAVNIPFLLLFVIIL